MTQKKSIPVKADVIAHTELPPYLRIADKAKDLRELGMSDRVIASVLGVSDKRPPMPPAWTRSSRRIGAFRNVNLLIKRIPPPTQQRRPRHRTRGQAVHVLPSGNHARTAHSSRKGTGCVHVSLHVKLKETELGPPPVEWIKDRLDNIQQVLEQRTARSAQTLRNLMGPIRLDLVTPDIGRPFYRALTSLDGLALIEEPPPAGAEGGSNSLQGGTVFKCRGTGNRGSSGGTFVQLPGVMCTS